MWPFALVLLLVRRRLSLRACAAIVTALAIGAVLWRSYLWRTAGLMVFQRTDFHFAELLLGCACGLVIAAGVVPTSPHGRRLLGALAWLSLIGILTLFVRGEPIYLNIVLAVVGLLPIVLITHLVVDRGSRLSSLLSWPPLVGIGQVSYGLYLWHWIWLQYSIWTEAVRLPVAVALTSAAVLASYYLVERPALRLKHRFQRTGDSRRSALRPGANASVSRRDLLPVLGMSSLAVAAVAAYALAGRLYPKDTLAGSAPEPEAPAPLAATPAPELAASTVTPAPTLVATPVATRVPRPTRIPRASRAATPRASRARPEDNVPGQPTATARPDRARTRTAGKD